MDDYLSEKEQIDQIKQWWHDYGWYLVGGAAVAALGYFGSNQYSAYRDSVGEQASALYADLVTAVEEDRDNIDAILDEIRTEFSGSPYVDQAGLLVARHYLVRDTARAAEELRRVVDTASDAELAMIARLRLARVEAYRENYDEAMAVLEVANPGMYEARIAEIRGDVYTARGDFEQAREAYVRALTSAGSDVLDRNLVQMKLNDLRPSGRPAATSEVPAETPAMPEAPNDSSETDASAESPDPEGDA